MQKVLSAIPKEKLCIIVSFGMSISAVKAFLFFIQKKLAKKWRKKVHKYSWLKEAWRTWFLAFISKSIYLIDQLAICEIFSHRHNKKHLTKSRVENWLINTATSYKNLSIRLLNFTCDVRFYQFTAHINVKLVNSASLFKFTQIPTTSWSWEW